VTLVVDSFHESHEATLAAIRQAASSRRSPAIYVLPPAAVHGVWQSWQQGRAAEPETFERLLAAHRIHGFHYLALGLIALAKGEAAWTDASRCAALAEGRKFYAAAHQRNVPQLDVFFLPPLLEALGLNWGNRVAWSDSWLEDTPSSNGSGSAETTKTSPAAPAEDSSPEASAVSNPPEPASAVPAPIGRPRGASEFCDFHQCDRVVCLCWD
jgi:hypothetical protein